MQPSYLCDSFSLTLINSHMHYDTNSTMGLQEASSMRLKRKDTTPAYLKNYVQHG